MLLRSVFAKTCLCWQRLANWVSSRHLCTRRMLGLLKYPGKSAQCRYLNSGGGSKGHPVVVIIIR
jgi:hypothetical protein